MDYFWEKGLGQILLLDKAYTLYHLSQLDLIMTKDIQSL